MHSSTLNDPAHCERGLVPIGSGDELGVEAFARALCSEAGGLVAVTARGVIVAREGQVHQVELVVEAYSDPQSVTFDASWLDRYGVLKRESEASWRSYRRQYCMIEGFVDPETFQRREPRPK